MEHALALAFSTISKMVDGFFILLPNLLIGLVVIVIFIKIAAFIKGLVVKIAHNAKLDGSLGLALGTICTIIVNLIGLLIAAVIVIPHFSLASVIGGLGVSGVAIGFAFKDILQNFLAGMLLLWQKPFSIGDIIKTQSYEGKVEDIRMRSTLLRTSDGALVLIPNSDIYTQPVVVNAASEKTKLHMTVNAKDAPVEDARKKCLEVLTSTEGVLQDPPPLAVVSDASSDNLMLELYFWSTNKGAETMELTDRIASRLRQLFHGQNTVTTAPEAQVVEPPAKLPEAHVAEPPAQLPKAS
jgi:small-conductance mechanosensitive channel